MIVIQQASDFIIEPQHVHSILSNAFPELASKLKQDVFKCYLHQNLSCFADLTKNFIEKQNYVGIQHCFCLADWILIRGDERVREAIETSYLHVLHLDSTQFVMSHVRPLLTPGLMRCERHLEYNQLP